MRFDSYEFTLGGWWASAIINGDTSGLTEKEAAQLADWQSDFHVNHPKGHWDGFSEDTDSMGFCRDEITGLAGDCYKVRYYFPLEA